MHCTAKWPKVGRTLRRKVPSTEALGGEKQYLPEFSEVSGGHALQGLTSDARVVPDRDCQVGVRPVAILHSEGRLLLLSLQQNNK